MCRASHPAAPNQDDVVRVLLATYLFSDMSPAELQPLAVASTVRQYARRERVFAVGDPAVALYVVVSGLVKDCVITPTGEEVIFEVISHGGVFGEPGLFSAECDRVADCVAVEPSRVLCIPRDVLAAFLDRHPSAMRHMLEGLATEARRYALQVADVAYLRIRQRVALKLLELVVTHGSDEGSQVRLQLTLSQSMLASMVGASRENVNRALSELVAAGAVRSEHGEYVVNAPRLRALTNQYTVGHRRNRLKASG
jgi:CRP/FNR family transcriptional regulator, cyclic AMP receptor protein